MELIQILYIPKKKQVLLLHLGDRNDKLCGLESSQVTERDAAIIKSSIPTLNSLSLERKITWLKEKCPTSFRSAYREVKNNNYTIIDKYDIK